MEVFYEIVTAQNISLVYSINVAITFFVRVNSLLPNFHCPFICWTNTLIPLLSHSM